MNTKKKISFFRKSNKYKGQRYEKSSATNELNFNLVLLH